MLKRMELNLTNGETNKKALRALAALVAVVLLVGVSALFLNNVIATPLNPREAQIRSWVTDLRDADLTAKRQEAQKNLEAAGAEAVPALVTALHANDPVVRRNAADMLGYIGSASAGDALVQALSQDPVPAVRTNAAYALGSIKSAAGLNALQRSSVLDTSAQVRQAASDSITAMTNAIAKSAGKDPAQVQAVAAQADTIYLASQRDLLVSRSGAQWETLTQALPSLASTLSINPTNPNILYAGMHSMGMFLSTDGGRTWQSLTRNFSNEAIGQSTVTAITVDPADPMRVIMAHGIRIGDLGATFMPLGILSSKDGGQTWANVTDLEEGQLVTQLAVKDNKVYALTGDKILIVPLP